MEFSQPSLPSTEQYRRDLVSEGATYPLPTVPIGKDLPPASATSFSNGWPWSIPKISTSQQDKLPKITIVTPSFQQGAYLEATIRSVLLQNYPNLEYIIVDGGSTDSTPEILEKYRPYLSYIRHSHDRGQSHAINLGFSLGSGDIFGWLNSDDCHLPFTLNAVAEAWRGGAEFIYGDHIETDAKDRLFTYKTASFTTARYRRFSGLFAQPSAFWAANRHLPIWEEMICSMDYELWIRLLPGLTTKYLPTALSIIRVHSEAKTHSSEFSRHWAADAQRNYQAHPGLFKNSRLLDIEYRLLQRIVHRHREKHILPESRRISMICGLDITYV